MMIRTVFLIVLLAGFSSMQVQAQQSMYQDDRAAEVGDILTVLLQENISGSTSSDAENASNAAAGASGSASGNFLPFKPTFGAGTEVNYDSDEQVSTNQGQLLQGYMTVEIVERTEGGALRIEGQRSTEINGERHSIELSGLVRPRDINGRNQVLSYRIGNARINYEKDSDLKGMLKKEGLLKRVILTGVGAVLGAAVVMKAMK